jgi:hypothetical protein
LRELAFRSALPRGERPCRRHGQAGQRAVSIRAPARGATRGCNSTSG